MMPASFPSPPSLCLTAAAKAVIEERRETSRGQGQKLIAGHGRLEGRRFVGIAGAGDQ
jgi:hypothetical protein